MRWAEADKHVESLRDQMFAESKERVTAWKGRRAEAMSRNTYSDEAYEKKMADAFKTKEQRFKEWRIQNALDLERKAREVAAMRKEASARFGDELANRDSRLEQAQEVARQNRMRMEREKRQQLKERAERAEQKAEEVWQARVRVENALKAKTSEYETECKRKAQQAEDCLRRRAVETEGKRHNNNVWRIPGCVPDRGLL